MASHKVRELSTEKPAWKPEEALGACCVGCDDVEYAVLVGVRKITQDGERVRGRLAVVVGLQRVDEGEGHRINAAVDRERSWRPGLSGRRLVHERELRSSGYRTCPVRLDKTTCEMIERGPEVVNAVTYGQTEGAWWRSVNVELKEDQTVIAWLDVQNKVIRFRVKVGRYLVIERLEVLPSTIEPEVDIGERVAWP